MPGTDTIFYYASQLTTGAKKSLFAVTTSDIDRDKNDNYYQVSDKCRHGNYPIDDVHQIITFFPGLHGHSTGDADEQE